MKDLKYIELTTKAAKEMDKALEEIASNLGILAAYGISSPCESITLLNMWGRDLEKWIKDHLEPDQADSLIDELCKEVD